MVLEATAPPPPRRQTPPSPPPPPSFAAATDIILGAISTGEALDAAAAARKQTVEAMRHYLGPSRLALDLSSLRVLHVTGTKGKGSTCAFAEAVLQRHGMRTGMYTSPHLLRVNERVRVGGRPLPEHLFARYTHEVWQRLQETAGAAHGTGFPPMPTFFRLLTLIGLWTFVHEKVDIAISEVGMGGRYDATNVIPPPLAAGVTTLDYDHTAILGETLAEIAWEKGGIFKHGASCYSVHQSCAHAAAVLERCAADAQEPLTWVEMVPEGVSLGLDGAAHQRVNAGLALALCARALGVSGGAAALLSDPNTLEGLASAHWPGRCQILHRPGAIFYLDGAHTETSVRTAARWFEGECRKRAQQDARGSRSSSSGHARRQRRHLIFNCSHERDATALLLPLLQLGREGTHEGSAATIGMQPFFEAVHFVKTDGRPSRHPLPTAAELVARGSGGTARVLEWKPSPAADGKDSAPAPPVWQSTVATVWQSLQTWHQCSGTALSDVRVDCAREASRTLAAGGGGGCDSGTDDVLVLATGSLYLVAAVLEGVGWAPDE